MALPADNELRLPIFETVVNGITVVGSIVGTRKDLREVFELHSAGLTRVISEMRPLRQVNEAIADVEARRCRSPGGTSRGIRVGYGRLGDSSRRQVARARVRRPA